ncbi:hypothetical protein ANO11243_058840 [Dothideomycetidae sp. 11243]|nr:hypothetical protein ANO11243_058840 [fungal sp. No.11243]
MWAAFAPRYAPSTPEPPGDSRGINVSDWQTSCEDDMSWAVHEDCLPSCSESHATGYIEQDSSKSANVETKHGVLSKEYGLAASLDDLPAPSMPQELAVWASYYNQDPTHVQCSSPTSPTLSPSTSRRAPRQLPLPMASIDQVAYPTFSHSSLATNADHMHAIPEGFNHHFSHQRNDIVPNDFHEYSSSFGYSARSNNSSWFAYPSEDLDYSDLYYRTHSDTHSPEQSFSSTSDACLDSYMNESLFTDDPNQNRSYPDIPPRGHQDPYQPLATPYSPQLPPAVPAIEQCGHGPWQPIEPRPSHHRRPSVSSVASASQSSAGKSSRSRPAEHSGVREHPYYQACAHTDGLYYCPYTTTENCNHKPTKLKCNYDKYIDSHIKPFRCRSDQECGILQFSSTACLLRHEREAHGMHGHGARPYLCQYPACERAEAGKGFPRHYNLMDHMRRVHGHEESAETAGEGRRTRTKRGGKRREAAEERDE